MDDDQTAPSRIPEGDALTIEPCVAINLAQETMNFDRRYILSTQKLDHRTRFTVAGCWNKSLQLELLPRCYCENSGGPASARVMRQYYSSTYMQPFQVINILLAVGRVGNLLCGRPSYIIKKLSRHYQFHEISNFYPEYNSKEQYLRI